MNLLDKLFKKSSEPKSDNDLDIHQLQLATCILLIEVSKSDDDYDPEEQEKIILLTSWLFIKSIIVSNEPTLLEKYLFGCLTDSSTDLYAAKCNFCADDHKTSISLTNPSCNLFFDDFYMSLNFRSKNKIRNKG